jgi:hypothetical protein
MTAKPLEECTIHTRFRLVSIFATSSLAVVACGSGGSTSTGAPSTTELLATTGTPSTESARTTGPPTTTGAIEPVSSAEGALDFNLSGEPGSSPSVFGYGALTDVDDVALVDDVNAAMDEPDADTGWIPMPSAYACTGASEYRSLLWDDIRVVLAHRTAAVGSTTYMAAWSIGDAVLAFSPALEAEITRSSGITTGDGIGLGTSVDRLDELEWDQSDRDGDRFFGLAGIGPVVFQLDGAGHVTAMSFEQNDC